MERQAMLDLLKRIKISLELDSLDIAKQLVRLEIENLKGITEVKCKNHIYCYDWYCQYCRNFNCNGNQNKELSSY